MQQLKIVHKIFPTSKDIYGKIHNRILKKEIAMNEFEIEVILWKQLLLAAAMWACLIGEKNKEKKKERIYVKIFYHFDGLCLLCLHYTHQIWCNISLILVQKLSWIFCKSKMPPNLLLWFFHRVNNLINQIGLGNLFPPKIKGLGNLF